MFYKVLLDSYLLYLQFLATIKCQRKGYGTSRTVSTSVSQLQNNLFIHTLLYVLL